MQFVLCTLQLENNYLRLFLFDYSGWLAGWLMEFPLIRFWNAKWIGQGQRNAMQEEDDDDEWEEWEALYLIHSPFRLYLFSIYRFRVVCLFLNNIRLHFVQVSSATWRAEKWASRGMWLRSDKWPTSFIFQCYDYELERMLYLKLNVHNWRRRRPAANRVNAKIIVI